MRQWRSVQGGEVPPHLVNSVPNEPRDCVKSSTVFLVWNMMSLVGTLPSGDSYCRVHELIRARVAMPCA